MLFHRAPLETSSVNMLSAMSSSEGAHVDFGTYNSVLMSPRLYQMIQSAKPHLEN